LAADTPDVGLLSERRDGPINVFFPDIRNMDDSLAAPDSC
jgi:hypothetical protein